MVSLAPSKQPGSAPAPQSPFFLRRRRLTMRVATLEPTPLEATVRIRGPQQKPKRKRRHERRDTSTRMANLGCLGNLQRISRLRMAVE